MHMVAQPRLRVWRAARNSAERAVLWQTHFLSTEVSRHRKRLVPFPEIQHPPAGGQGNHQDEVHTYGAISTSNPDLGEMPLPP